MKDFVLIVGALAALSACSKSKSSDTPGAELAGGLASTLGAGVSRPSAPVMTPVVAPASAPAATAVPMALPSQPDTVVDVSKRTMSVDRYERFVLNLEGCSLERYQIDANCAGMQALTEAINASSTWRDRAVVNAQIGARLIGHRSPAIRVKAAELLAGVADGFDTIAAAAAAESDAGVLQAFIRTSAKQGAANPRVAGMLLSAADHADKDVRLQAIYALAAPHNKGMSGGAAKLVAIAERDAERSLRLAACEHGGRLGDSTLIPLYEKTTASAADREMYGACMEGLVAMFHNHPSFDTANEDAYRLFLRRITTGPRSEHAPPWSVMSTFCYFSHESDQTKLAAWKQQSAPWFDAGEMRKALASVVVDKHAGWMARTASIESLVGLGASKAELAELKKGYDAANATDKQVLDKLAAAMDGKK